VTAHHKSPALRRLSLAICHSPFRSRYATSHLLVRNPFQGLDRPAHGRPLLGRLRHPSTDPRSACRRASGVPCERDGRRPSARDVQPHGGRDRGRRLPHARLPHPGRRQDRRTHPPLRRRPNASAGPPLAVAQQGDADGHHERGTGELCGGKVLAAVETFDLRQDLLASAEKVFLDVDPDPGEIPDLDYSDRNFRR